MNTLIITYNIKDINVLEYDTVLYLVESININIKKKLTNKHVSIIKNKDIHLELINQVQKYYNHFDKIILIDNSYEYFIEKTFKDIKKNDWIITGNICSEKWVKEEFVPSYFNLNKLMFNCNNLNNIIFDYLKPCKIKDICFPYFSRVIYEYYNKVYSYQCDEIKKIEKYNNILI